ncbi:hypothetical protein AYI68_g7655 [Smittium mucronatum]|uniref:Uncharacterized protein n=1 Tax=Smittium mucronatum TaxID=133383 RepID=A0A1R0GN43_9FUNG|nr:hypothetical protein AYI68_g7655 [Smittium mucronatum]
MLLKLCTDISAPTNLYLSIRILFQKNQMDLDSILRKSPHKPFIPQSSNIVPNNTEDSSCLNNSFFSTPSKNNPNSTRIIADATPSSIGFPKSPALPMASIRLNRDFLSQRTPLHKYLYNANFSPYSPAKRPSSRTSSSNDMGNNRSQYIYSDTNYMSPEEVYENFNLNLTMSIYIERLIKWFSRCLLQPLASKILYIDNIFDNNGLSHLNCQNSSSTDAIPFNLNISNQQQSTSLFSNSSLQTQSIPSTLNQLASSQYASNDFVKQRLSLEKYLSVPGYVQSRKYIVHRILLLASSNFLKEYKWDGGGDHPDTKNWNSSSDPTDSQIIQVVKKPPHFCLVVKNTYYDAPANYHNLFFVLCLALLIIKNECGFYLETTNLASKHLGLAQILE